MTAREQREGGPRAAGGPDAHEVAAPARAALQGGALVAMLLVGAAVGAVLARSAGSPRGAAPPDAAGTATPSDGFLPHGYCFLWNEPLLWTHVVTDVLIGLSYVVIAATLVHFTRRARRDLPFSYIFVAFGLFIVACGGTHFMEVWTFWEPVYWLSGVVKVVTAVASVSTAVVLPFTIPSVHLTIREAKLARAREAAAARAAALEEHNSQLRDQAAELEAQATELEEQREQATALAEELRAANARLGELNASLEVALADARAARETALAAQRTAEAANAVKGDFLAVMSHELRTPLQAVIGYADLLELGTAGPVSDRQVAQLARIRGSAQHLVGLIDQILTFSRLEAGADMVHPEPMDAADVAMQAADMVRPLAAARGLAFHVELPRAGAVPMVSDPQRLRQMLLNLLTNAVKYTPAGHVRLSAERRPGGGRSPEPGAADGGEDEGEVVFRVSDTGIGIAPEHHGRVFEPFWQAAPALTRGVGGTGLGLSVVRELARALGGEVTLESRPGVGSTFSLRLPVRAPQPARVDAS